MLDWTPLVAQVDKSIVRMDLGSGNCSAVVIEVTPSGDALALTAAHCVSKDAPIAIDNVDGEYIHSNPILDLALIRFHSPDAQPMTFATKMPSAGSEIAVCGYGFGTQSLASQFGHMAQDVDKKDRVFWVNADVLFGDSGGAVIDSSGHLIGIVNAIWASGPAHIGIATQLSVLKDFFDSAKKLAK